LLASFITVQCDQRVERISFVREIDGKRVEASAEILPTIYGLPITADQDKYLALAEIISRALQTDGKLKIRFGSRRLNFSASSKRKYASEKTPRTSPTGST
jgi:hypothetical protein